MLQAQPPNRPDGKSAASEPLLGAADAGVQAEPPERPDGKSIASEPLLGATDALQELLHEPMDGKSAVSEGAVDAGL